MCLCILPMPKATRSLPFNILAIPQQMQILGCDARPNRIVGRSSGLRSNSHRSWWCHSLSKIWLKKWITRKKLLPAKKLFLITQSMVISTVQAVHVWNHLTFWVDLMCCCLWDHSKLALRSKHQFWANNFIEFGFVQETQWDSGRFERGSFLMRLLCTFSNICSKSPKSSWSQYSSKSKEF